MGQNWLFKTEPSAYSFDRLEREGHTTWDGVANALAQKHLRGVTSGDRVLIYHTGDEKAVVGVATAVSDAYPDRKSKDGRTVVVDIEATRRLARPVTLAELKARPSLADFALVRLPRLSVMPVSATQWKEIERLATSASSA